MPCLPACGPTRYGSAELLGLAAVLGLVRGDPACDRGHPEAGPIADKILRHLRLPTKAPKRGPARLAAQIDLWDSGPPEPWDTGPPSDEFSQVPAP